MINGINSSTNRKKKIYGDPLVSLYSLLHNLRVKYAERNKDKPDERCIELTDFGIRIRFSESASGSDSGYCTIIYRPDFTDMEQLAFGDTLMFKLIEFGYMEYIKNHPDGGRGRIFRILIIKQNWGRRIIEKRLAYWKNKPTRKYLYDITVAITTEFSSSEIVDRYPDFFSFLYY
jgi:hypothetical protein